MGQKNKSKNKPKYAANGSVTEIAVSRIKFYIN